MLVLHRHHGRSVDSSVFQYPHRLPGKRQSLSPTELLLLHHRSSLFRLCWLRRSNRPTQRRTDHLFATACPAFVEPRVTNQNRQVVTAPIMTCFRARWASRHIVPPDFPRLVHMFQDVELYRALFASILECALRLRYRRSDTCGHSLASNKTAQFAFRHPPQPVQVADLCVECVVRSVKPESTIRPTMNTQRTTNCVAELTPTEPVVLRENFNSIPQPPALHPHTQSQPAVVDVNPALLGQHRCGKKNPEVTAAFAHL